MLFSIAQNICRKRVRLFIITEPEWNTLIDYKTRESRSHSLPIQATGTTRGFIADCNRRRTNLSTMQHDQASNKNAPLRFRFFAMVYDALVVLGIWILSIAIIVTATGDAVTGAGVQSLLFIEMFAFFAYFWIHRGQTIGMLAWRLKVVCDEPFTLRHALLRFIGAVLAFASLVLGYFWIWIDQDQRSWSDMLSKSRVVRYSRPKSTIHS